MPVMFKGYKVYSDGTIIGKFGKTLRWRTSRGGYQKVAICENGKCYQYSVHRLVAMLFIPNPANKPEVNHRDRDKRNNHVTNLEWATRSENNKHAPSQAGRTGSLSSQSKTVVSSDVRITPFASVKEAAKYIGIHPTTLSRKIRGLVKNDTGMSFA